MLPRRQPGVGEEHRVDETLRYLLAPEPAAVQRLRRRALAPAAGGSGQGAGEGIRGRRWAMTVLILSTLGILWIAETMNRGAGDLDPRESRAGVSRIELRAAEPARLKIQNIGGVVAVIAPDGQICVLVAGG